MVIGMDSSTLMEYLAPLSNNERAVLIAAAFNSSTPTRNRTVKADLRGDYGHRIPDAQIDRAMKKLVDKGYATMEPRRANINLTGWGGRYLGTIDGHGMRSRQRMAPAHKAFIEKQNGAGHLRTLGWSAVARLVPVEDLLTAVIAWRKEAKRQALEREAEAGRASEDRTKELQDGLAEACREYLKALEDGTVMTPSAAGFYEVHDSVRTLASYSDTLKRWSLQRYYVERDGQRAQKELAA